MLLSLLLFNVAISSAGSKLYYLQVPRKNLTCVYTDVHRYVSESKRVNSYNSAVLDGDLLTVDYGDESGDWFVEDIYDFGLVDGPTLKRVFNIESISVRTSYNLSGANPRLTRRGFYNLSTGQKIRPPKGFNPDVNIPIYNSKYKVEYLKFIPEGGKECRMGSILSEN